MIVVLGSLNMDFVVSVEHLPAPGETVLGHNFAAIPGGKGANQAYAAARLVRSGMSVAMIGCVGADVFGDQLKAGLASAGADVSAVRASATLPSGVALIWVDRAGQNSIVVASGANMDIPASAAESMRPVFRGRRIALFQLETPLDTVAAALRIAREEGLTTILDPAPAQPLPDSLLAQVDILTPNETEALALLGRPARRVEAGEAAGIAAALRARGPRTVILKLGDQGAFADRLYPAEPVQAVDTTAAGDTFNAALAVALAEGLDLPQAIPFANAAAAFSVQRRGAQSSAPSRADLEMGR